MQFGGKKINTKSLRHEMPSQNISLPWAGTTSGYLEDRGWFLREARKATHMEFQALTSRVPQGQSGKLQTSL
jgi:hypothetical protein